MMAPHLTAITRLREIDAKPASWRSPLDIVLVGAIIGEGALWNKVKTPLVYPAPDGGG
jgi:hypothetical protein